MDFAQLKSSLKVRVEPVYLLHGTDYFLINKAVSLIQASLPSVEVTKFGEDASNEEIVTALSTTSFFTNPRLVIATLGEKPALSGINQYIKNPVDQNVLVLISYREKPEQQYAGYLGSGRRLFRRSHHWQRTQYWRPLHSCQGRHR